MHRGCRNGATLYTKRKGIEYDCGVGGLGFLGRLPVSRGSGYMATMEKKASLPEAH